VILSGRAYSALIAGLLLLIVLSAGLALDSGAADIALGTALIDLWQGKESLAATVVGDIRLPRVLLAMIVGASLAMAGAAMQMLLRNPLAEPGILGVSSGAALGAVSVLYFGLAASNWFALPFAAIAGALLSLLLVYLLAGFQASIMALVLAGLAMSSLTAALIAVALNFAPSFYAMQEIVFWLMGSLSNRHMDHLWIALPFCLISWILLLSRSRFLDALSLGEDSAESLGFHLPRERIILLVAIALCVGACVAVSGSIGFVGLMVPHLMRPLVGYQPSRLLLTSALAGAVLLLWADLLVRQLDMVRELKLGVVTALLGAPFFLFLMIKLRTKMI
jgi:iron complex transport system permease protein